MTKLSEEDIRKIREEAKTMKSRYEIAREFNVHHTVIYRYTADIPTPRLCQPFLGSRSVELLKQIMTDGYIIREKDRNGISKIQQLFPIIKRTQFNGKAVFYLEDKNKIALEQMIRKYKKKVIKYSDLTQLSKLFHVKINRYEKDELFNIKTDRKPIICRKGGGFSSSYSKYQTNLDDY